MKKTKTITREFDELGRCIKEVIVEDDAPQYPGTYVNPSPWNPAPSTPYRWTCTNTTFGDCE